MLEVVQEGNSPAYHFTFIFIVEKTMFDLTILYLGIAINPK